MNFFPENILLNAKRIPVRKFIKKNHFSKHEKALAGFLEEWYAPANSIEVQTSGSTGIPKTIRLKKDFIAQSAMRTLKFFNLKEGDRVLHCLPVKYIAGKLMVIRALIGNLDMYYTHPSTSFSFLQTKSFRFAAMIPHQVQKILDSGPAEESWIQNISNLLIGGSAIPHPLENRLKNVSSACWSSYAMTETATHVALRKINDKNADEYYHCLEDITVQLSDIGCLNIYMPGLPQQPLKTNDIAEIQDPKTFRILGRADNVIISGGLKFSPEQLEKKLEQYLNLPFLITSLPHESLGQQLALVIEGTETGTAIPGIKEICQSCLKKYEQPRKILFIPLIPKTDSGKPDRNALKSCLNY